MFKLIEGLKSIVRKTRLYVKYKKPEHQFHHHSEKDITVFLMGDPEYENLGDHAIAYATEVFVRRNFAEYDFCGIPEMNIVYDFKNVVKCIRKQDILLLQGGGNMGDIYPEQVKIRKKIIKAFPENKIIIMPQTIHFSDSVNQKLPAYYEEHRHLTLFAREEVSYKMMKNLYPGEVFLVPDIVLFLSGKIDLPDTKRDGALICIRSDKESSNLENLSKTIEDALNCISMRTEYISTVVNEAVSVADRNTALNDLFAKFCSAELVITDRLHGMIIAALTNTPCVVLPTFNHKVTACYKWIKEISYIEMCTSVKVLEASISRVLSVSEHREINLEDKFEALIQSISEDN